MEQSEKEAYYNQQVLQDQQLEASRFSQAPYLAENVRQNQAITIQETNPLFVLNEIELRLKGKERMADGSTINRGKSWMNDKGANKMISIMSAFVNQGTILSHLDKRQINKTILKLGDNIIDDLTLNWKQYEISDKADLDHITNIIIFPCYFALNRALEQNEKNWLSKISVESITNSPRIPQVKKDGFWSKFKL